MVWYLLNNYLSAYHYYKKREDSERPFLNAEREAVYRQRFGSAAFKSGATEVAVSQFKKALKIVEKQKALIAQLSDRTFASREMGGLNFEGIKKFKNDKAF